MKLQIVGCSHHQTPVELRERLAFSPDQTRTALARLHSQFPDSEAVLLSTCNRIELYTASENDDQCPTHHEIAEFFAEFHGLTESEIFVDLFERTGEEAIRHLFTVAASMDSMVVGEAQILSQVKQAYEAASAGDTAGTLLHSAFQAANRVAKRVATETAINKKRVSIPSVAVGEYAREFFEQFDDKKVLVIGAGEMGQETLKYLIDEGATNVAIINRSFPRAQQLAAEFLGEALPWEKLDEQLISADLVVSTTGATEPIVTADYFSQIQSNRYERLLFILDLAVPRDFEPEVGNFSDVYLYSVDDLAQACERNRRDREKEWPRAIKIIEEETLRYMTDLNHRATGPIIRRLRERAKEIKDEEFGRLINKLGALDQRQQNELERSFDRLVNKLLHPPLESLRDEVETGSPHGLLDALKRLFQLKD